MKMMKTVGAMVLSAGLMASASAADIYLTPGELTGSRSTAANGGLVADGNQATGGFELSWVIDFGVTNSDKWTYVYTIKRLAGSLVGISHFNLETSLNFDHPDHDAKVLVKNHPGSPTQPADIFGIKFDFEASKYTLVTDHAPIWGDVYGNKGTGGFYNIGIGTNPTAGDSPFTNWIATPDTVKTPPTTVIPTPAALGAGLMLMGLIVARRQRH